MAELVGMFVWLLAIFAATASASLPNPLASACAAHSQCLGLTGDCCPTPDGRTLSCCSSGEASVPQTSVPEASVPETAVPEAPVPEAPVPEGPSVSVEALGSNAPNCKAYLKAKGIQSPAALANQLKRCQVKGSRDFAPKPEPDIPGATDTTNLQCQYTSVLNEHSSCCGWRPHFNWVVGTCERNSRIPNATFCDMVPECAREPKINYAAAYQFNGSHFVLQDSSTAGDLSESGVSGSFASKTGWEASKDRFRWEGGEGDWPTKYAPWGHGESGPRGITPPAALWVLSTDSFYYGTLYMLSQLTLNTQGAGQHANCWEWEFDAIEGLIGTVPKGHPLPGNLNQLYVTATSQVTGCMPMPGTAAQGNGQKSNFSEPREFRAFCRKNPEAVGCQPWTAEGADIIHGGGYRSTDRFENAEDTPYVFAVVLDGQGFWVYRWRPDDSGETGWPGISRTKASRVLPKRPRRVTEGLETNVAADVREAVILVPGLQPEAACSRSLPEQVDWRWGAAALGSMAYEADQYKLGEAFQGAQNWWAHFADTEQLQDYPLSIAGVPASEAARGNSYTCDQREKFGSKCDCHDRRGSPASLLDTTNAAAPSSEVGLMIHKLLRGQSAQSAQTPVPPK